MLKELCEKEKPDLIIGSSQGGYYAQMLKGIISDNFTTAMTGGQDSAGTNKFEAICLGLGVEPEHLHVVVPLPKNMPEITRIIREEINYQGVSVIIPQRECIQTFKRHAKERKQNS